MRILWKTSLLGTACLLGLVHGNGHGQANDQKDSHAASVREGSRQPNDLGSVQCIEINARDSGGYSERWSQDGEHQAGGRQDGGRQDGGRQDGGHQKGGHQREAHQSGGHQKGGQPAKVCIALNGAQRGAGGAVGNGRATVIETVRLGGGALNNAHVSFVTHTSAIVSTMTHTSTIFTTVAAPSPHVAIPPPQEASHPPAAENSTAYPPPAAAPPVNPPQRAPAENPAPPPPESPPAPATVESNNASMPVLGIGSPGSFVAGRGALDSNGECSCYCLCEPGSFPINSIAPVPAAPEVSQIAPTTFQTVVSAAQTGPSGLPAAIPIPATTASLPDSLVVATGTPTVADPIAENTESSSSTALPSEPQGQGIAQVPPPTSIEDSTTTSTTSSTAETTASPTAPPTTLDSTTSPTDTSTSAVSDTTSETVESQPTSDPGSSEAAASPDGDIAAPASIDINTLTLSSMLALGNLARPTI